MRFVTALAALLGLEVNVLVERLRRDAALYAIVGTFGLLAVVFGLVALNAALTMLWGPIYAPLALGGFFAFIALVVWGSSTMSRRRRVFRERERKRSSETTAAVTTAAIAALPLLASSPLLRRWGLPVAGALGAAWFLMRGQGGDDDRSPPSA